MKKDPLKFNRRLIIGTGVTLIFFSVAILGVSLIEAFKGVQENYHVVRLPGFTELELNAPGLYAGILQTDGTTPLPLSKLKDVEVRLLSRDDYSEVPIMMNRGTGGTFNQLGQEGIVLFNFILEHPGPYSMSGFYLGEGEMEPQSVYLFAQAAQGIRQTMLVGGIFFLIFLGLGIFVLLLLRRQEFKAQSPV